MKKVQLSDIKNLVEYEKVRDKMRAEIIEFKKRRRVPLGDNLTLLFENRETVLFQIHEMVRTERIADPAKIQDEIDAYNALLPETSQLSATLFIEIPGIAAMSPDQVRAAVNRFQGIDAGCLFLELGTHRVPARFEGGHTKEEKLAGVQYLRFAVTPEAQQALADPAKPARLVVDHPRYKAEQALADGVRRQMLLDLGAE